MNKLNPSKCKNAKFKKLDVSQSLQIHQIAKLGRKSARELVCFKGTVWTPKKKNNK